MKLLIKICSVLFVLLVFHASYSQDSSSVIGKVTGFPAKFFSRVSNKMAGLNTQLDKQTQKYLDKLAKREEKIKRRMFRLDSNAAKNLFAQDPSKQYAALAAKLKSDTASVRKPSGIYLPYADSLQGALSFINKNPASINPSGIVPADMQKSLQQLQLLQTKMQNADMVTQFVQQRKEQLKQYLSHYTQLPSSITNAYQGYNKELYYYAQQLQEYKDILDDPDKMMKTVLTLLDKLPAFSNFMKSNSMLSSLFNMPGTYSPGTVGQGMPSRDQVMAALQNQIGSGGPNVTALVQQNTQSAQGQIDQLRNKALSYGSGGGPDIDVPNFKPNAQKSRSFLKRLELGTNMQSTKGSYFFPLTTDLGVSLGYRISNQNEVGVGASYKVGWGKDFGHIQFSSQGVGLRSYLDIQIKKSIFASGGFEYNYQQPFYSVDVFRQLQSWQQSGLIGVSKIVSLRTKVFKKTKLQLLWDFLSYQQIPKTQPFKFRVGYSF